MNDHITKAELAAQNPATEEEILTAILDYLQAAYSDGKWATVEPRGGFIRGRPTRKTYKAGVGVPDIVGCLYGRWVGIEVKTKNGLIRESQALFRYDIKHAWGYYEVCRSIEDVDEFLIPIVRMHG